MTTRLYQVSLRAKYGGGLLVIEARSPKGARKIADDWIVANFHVGDLDISDITLLKPTGKPGVMAEFDYVE